MEEMAKMVVQLHLLDYLPIISSMGFSRQKLELPFHFSEIFPTRLGQTTSALPGDLCLSHHRVLITKCKFKGPNYCKVPSMYSLKTVLASIESIHSPLKLVCLGINRVKYVTVSAKNLKLSFHIRIHNG